MWIKPIDPECGCACQNTDPTQLLRILCTCVYLLAFVICIDDPHRLKRAIQTSIHVFAALNKSLTSSQYLRILEHIIIGSHITKICAIMVGACDLKRSPPGFPLEVTYRRCQHSGKETLSGTSSFVRFQRPPRATKHIRGCTCVISLRCAASFRLSEHARCRARLLLSHLLYHPSRELAESRCGPPGLATLLLPPIFGCEWKRRHADSLHVTLGDRL